jgi:hypothetical protein
MKYNFGFPPQAQLVDFTGKWNANRREIVHKNAHMHIQTHQFKLQRSSYGE